MSKLYPSVDPDGLLEYSVVFNDRSLNHMSLRFQGIMRDISHTLKEVYRAHAVALVPGGGTFGMEAIARQLATGKRCLVVRNGWFSYRWTQIFEAGQIPASHEFIKARAIDPTPESAFIPPPLEDVLEKIASQKPDLVFAAHVETASGILLPEAYLKALADAVHRVGGLFVLDCVASGALWIDMQAVGVDVLLSAPQKGWSGSPCSALILLSPRGLKAVETTKSSSFACDLLKWLEVMRAYEAGGFAYHATMPTDALAHFHAALTEMKSFDFSQAAAAQIELGEKVRAMLTQKGFKSVAAKGFEAPGVVVCHTQDTGFHKGSDFIKQGLQIAAGVPLQCDEGENFKSFRIGLFGLDKLKHIDRTVQALAQAIDRIVEAR